MQSLSNTFKFSERLQLMHLPNHYIVKYHYIHPKHLNVSYWKTLINYARQNGSHILALVTLCPLVVGLISLMSNRSLSSVWTILMSLCQINVIHWIKEKYDKSVVFEAYFSTFTNIVWINFCPHFEAINILIL